jgi:hypothetical protein
MRVFFCVGNLIFLVSPEVVIRVKIATVTYPILILETVHISASGTIEKQCIPIRLILHGFCLSIANALCFAGVLLIFILFSQVEIVID